MPDAPHLPDAVFESRDMRTFNRLFVQLPEIRLYGALVIAAAAVAVWLAASIWDLLLPALAVVLGYPVFEYVLHRWLLHNTNLCKTPFTARVWWRIHYRHHSAPRDAAVILGAPWSLIVAVSVGALLAASLYWSFAALAGAVAMSLCMAMAYEYFHSLEHSRVELTNAYLLRMRKHHIAHHYMSEAGNYGIVTDIVDRLTGTVVTPQPDAARSPTVFNLGYTGDLTRRYPWVEQIERDVGPATASARSGEAAPPSPR